MAELRLKIAVFIDFDNIEIGVKTTLGGRFDAGAVLEAVKERGEVVTKVAYGDWTRAGDYSRDLTQHGIQMVQRSLTPGGDKNGADINLALDALEMAFTHGHINAFVIVGGDSDFMALVEKLKQYDRQVIVVGGRQFTSTILQRNCHEFIAYENVTRDRRSGGRRGAAKNPAEAMPLVKRALKILADREVIPQLGVLKSTLLQLDPTFSEREYGVSSFRDFAEGLARGAYVTLKGTDRSLRVELREGTSDTEAASAGPEVVAAQSAAASEPAETNGAPAGRQEDGFAILRETFLRPGLVQRWPLYVRQVKQILRSANDGFDERRYGFAGILDALRYGQRHGLFRLERDRQGVIRVHPGALFQQTATPSGPTGDQVAEKAQPTRAEAATEPAEQDAGPEVATQPEPQPLFESEATGDEAKSGEGTLSATPEDTPSEPAAGAEQTKAASSARTRTRKRASPRATRAASSRSKAPAASASKGTRKAPAARKRTRKTEPVRE